jgi:hypothetical protein
MVAWQQMFLLLCREANEVFLLGSHFVEKFAKSGSLPEADDVVQRPTITSVRFWRSMESVFQRLPVEVETWMVSIFFVRHQLLLPVRKFCRSLS